MLRSLETAVRECEPLFMKGFESAKTIHFKGSVDLVTEYDVAIERQLGERLRGLFPDYTVVGEEGDSASKRPAKAIYVDPIDGTTNFVHGIVHCAVSVGLWDETGPRCAVVYNPVLNECYTAERGRGAFLNGEPIRVTRTATLQNALLATGFPYTKVERGRDYDWVLACMRNLLPVTRDIRRLGSASIDLCYVARGVFDAFYECNLKPWDVAAGILIVEEAGGRVSTETGGDYALDAPIIVAANPAVHPALIEALAPY